MAFVILNPLPMTVTASRGTGAANLATPDPKEVWADSATSGSAQISIDLGSLQTVDTVFFGHLRPPAAGATWLIVGGVAGHSEFTILNQTALRVPDSTGQFAETSHALWRGAAVQVRYIRMFITQPAGLPALTAGVLAIGAAFVPLLGQEWGAGRRPIDTGRATPLPSGGFGVVPGAHKRALSWTFGDLSIDETDRLEAIADVLGETSPGLVISDDARTAGLRRRIHWGLFEKWRAFERRNRRQTRWEIGIEEWS